MITNNNNNNNQEFIICVVLQVEKEEAEGTARTVTAVGKRRVIRNSELLRTYEVFIRASHKSLTYKFLR